MTIFYRGMGQMSAGIAAVVELVERILRDGPGEPKSGPLTDSLAIFSIKDRGLALSGDAADAYYGAIRALYQSLSARDQQRLSRRTVQNVVQQVVLDGLEMPGATPHVRRRVVRNAMADGLKKPDRTWTFYAPIRHLRVGPRLRQFGGVIFRDSSAAVIARLQARGNSIFLGSADPSPQKVQRADQFKSHVDDALKGAALAEFVVRAADLDAATALAHGQLEKCLDAIAFCSSVTHQLGTVGVPAFHSLERPGALVAKFGDDGSFSFNPWRKPDLVLDLSTLFKASAAPLTRKVSRLCSLADPVGLDDRLVTAICWAGRAMNRLRPAEGFLGCLIALESLLLGPKGEGELTYRLCVRGGHLIAKRNPESRLVIAREIRSLYAIRSGIVHSGHATVPAEKLETAQRYVKLALLTLLVGRRRPKPGQDLEDWFERKVMN